MSEKRAAPAGPPTDGDDAPTLPQLSRDEDELGWGDRDPRRDEDWYRRERPPHHE